VYSKSTVLLISFIAIFFFASIISGCNLGFGIKIDSGIGKLYFDSLDPEIYGEVYVDSIHIGYLKPLDRVSTFVALDFDHEVWVQCGNGVEYRWIFRAPFTGSQVIPLSLENTLKKNYQ